MTSIICTLKGNEFFIEQLLDVTVDLTSCELPSASHLGDLKGTFENITGEWCCNEEGYTLYQRCMFHPI